MNKQAKIKEIKIGDRTYEVIDGFTILKSINKNGMMNGAIIGGTYVILLYLISSLLNTGFALNIYTIIMIISGIISGIIGGILGVNT